MNVSPAGVPAGMVILTVNALSVPDGEAFASTGPVTLPSRSCTGWLLVTSSGLWVPKYLPVTVTVVPAAAAPGLADSVAAAVQPYANAVATRGTAIAPRPSRNQARLPMLLI